MRDRHYKLTPEPPSEEARKKLTGGRDEMIRDATERAARISDSTHQGHVLNSLLRESISQVNKELTQERTPKLNGVKMDVLPLPVPESKFEAGIQDIIGLLEMAEGELAQSMAHTSNTRQAQILISNARRKLVALAKEERR